MPELPEVEIICRNLSEMIGPDQEIREWIFFRPDLRFKIPKAALQKVKGKLLLKIARRAKYIVFDFGEYSVISHLGMTGSWRQVAAHWDRRKHDHLAFILKNTKIFVFEDPRRFGFIEVVKTKQLINRFRDLGVEPLDKMTDFSELTRRLRKVKSPIKTAIMNQKFLVGVGNIYASEALFRAGVNPLKVCTKIGIIHFEKIWEEIIVLLNEAIAEGGSTIENYRNSFGEKGDFQKCFFVYGRKNEPCLKCKTLINSIFQSGRSTFWCPSCQKK